MVMVTRNKDVVRKAEGLRLEAYLDTGGVWTIGYGHTGPEVVRGLKITLEKAEAYLSDDLKTAERGVNSSVSVPLTQNQFDALVSFTYNVGVGAFKTSTLLKMLNVGDYQGAADQLLRWNKDAGRVVQGLVSRRESERKLFLS